MERTVPLDDLTALVNPELTRVNRELARDLVPSEPELWPLVEHAGKFRGKQLRPALVLLTAKATGEVREEHITVAKVVELIHTATLVHDDILDGASLRRQLPTVNNLHGNEVSVLLGDYIYARAFQMSVEMDDQTCSRTLADVTRIICQGEITQLLHRYDFDWTEERYERVIADKTASLFAAAAGLGAFYAGASTEVTTAMKRYGRALGIAFQIADDCLDLTGDEKVVGKSLGTDFDRGKLTLPLLYLMEQSAENRTKMRELMGKPGNLAALADTFDLDDAREFSLGVARKHIQEARDALQIVAPGPAREVLADIAQFVVRRER